MAQNMMTTNEIRERKQMLQELAEIPYGDVWYVNIGPIPSIRKRILETRSSVGGNSIIVVKPPSSDKENCLLIIGFVEWGKHDAYHCEQGYVIRYVGNEPIPLPYGAFTIKPTKHKQACERGLYLMTHEETDVTDGRLHIVQHHLRPLCRDILYEA